MLRTKYFFILILLQLNFHAVSQTEEMQRILHPKVVLGGNFGLQLGTITQIEVSPLVGYKVLKPWQVGVRVSYTYFKNFNYDISNHLYGYSAWTRIFVFQKIFGHAEYEQLSIQRYDPNIGNYTGDRLWITGLLVGIGYSRMMGERAAANMSILWNLNQISDTPYSNPVIRVGFYF